MRSCFGCLALFVLIIVASYDAWLAVGWLLDAVFNIGGTLPGIMLQVFPGIFFKKNGLRRRAEYENPLTSLNKRSFV